MHHLEIDAAKALNNCTFVPGTRAKRFARDLSASAEASPDAPLSIRQKMYLWSLVYHFRRQIYGGHQKFLYWTAELITGKVDPKYTLPDGWLDNATGYAQKKHHAMLKDYTESVKAELDVAMKILPKSKQPRPQKQPGYLRRRCGCEYVDGRVVKACEAHESTWASVLKVSA
jgi:hypothetical protein